MLSSAPAGAGLSGTYKNRVPDRALSYAARRGLRHVGGKMRWGPSSDRSNIVMHSATAGPSPTSLFSNIAAPEPVQVPKPRSGPITGADLAVLVKRFKRLQNGSDIRGIAMEGVPNEPVTLFPGAVFYIGYAFARMLAARNLDGLTRVSVGRDPRLSGPQMEAALVAGLVAGGAKAVHVFGLATTPCMFYSIVEAGYTGAIMLTASHMPWNANGLKFFTKVGGAEKGDISELLQHAAQAAATDGVMIGEVASESAAIVRAALSADPARVQHVDFRPRYAAFLRELIVKAVASKDNPLFPLLGFKIVVDAGNGGGGFFATEVLAPLGATITGSQFLDPDGSFPNHIPNPEHPSAMAAGAAAVRAAGADLGIVFDTDVDRSAIVDRTGREINSNRFIALMASIVLRDHPGTTIVTDSVTSNGLADFIAQLGGKHVRYKRGYKNVIGQGVLLNKQGVETHLMMETSGHGAIKENYYLDDGAYLAVKVVIEAVKRRQAGGGDVGELLAGLREPADSRELRLRITDPDFKPLGSTVLQKFHDWVAAGAGAGSGAWTLDPVNHEGWRVNIDEGGGKRGWALLRQSLHDPLLVLNVESEIPGGVQPTIARILDFFLANCQGMALDLSALSK